MKSISEKLAAIAKADDEFKTWSFVYENWYDADTVTDRVGLPAIICILPASGEVEERNGRSYTTENLILAFVDKVEHRADGHDNEVVKNNMLAAARRYFRLVNNSGYFTPLPQRMPFNVVYQQLSSIVTGVTFEIGLQEVQCSE